MPRLANFLNKQSSLRALFCFIFIMFLSIQAVPAQTGIVAGIKSTYWDRYVHIGLINKLSERISVYTSAEAGGGEYDFSPLVLVTIPMSKSIIIGFMLGPEIQIYNETPTDGEVLTYLSAATGIAISVHITKELSLFSSFDYTKNESIERNSRFGGGVVFWLPVKK